MAGRMSVAQLLISTERLENDRQVNLKTDTRESLTIKINGRFGVKIYERSEIKTYKPRAVHFFFHKGQPKPLI